MNKLAHEFNFILSISDLMDFGVTSLSINTSSSNSYPLTIPTSLETFVCFSTLEGKSNSTVRSLT